MSSKDLKFTVEDFQLIEMDMVCNIEVGYDDPVECVIRDFVPDDYNIGERIVGGYDTPNYAEFTDEDYTPQDWWDERTTDEKKEMIREEIIKRLTL